MGDWVKGILVGLLYFAIFASVGGLLSVPLYTALVWVFGEVPFSERFLSAIPYLGLRSLQVAACAAAGVYAGAWVCGRLVSDRTVNIALTTFVIVAVGMVGASLAIDRVPELIDIIFVLINITLGYSMGDELLKGHILRRTQSRF